MCSKAYFFHDHVEPPCFVGPWTFHQEWLLLWDCGKPLTPTFFRPDWNHLSCGPPRLQGVGWITRSWMVLMLHKIYHFWMVILSHQKLPPYDTNRNRFGHLPCSSLCPTARHLLASYADVRSSHIYDSYVTSEPVREGLQRLENDAWRCWQLRTWRAQSCAGSLQCQSRPCGPFGFLHVSWLTRIHRPMFLWIITLNR